MIKYQLYNVYYLKTTAQKSLNIYLNDTVTYIHLVIINIRE